MTSRERVLAALREEELTVSRGMLLAPGKQE